MRRVARRGGALLAGVLLMGGAACGGGDDAQPAAGGDGRTITIKDFDYAPRDIEAKVGDTITVVNEDSASHTLTAEDKAFDTGPFGKETKTFTVTKAGKFTYSCTVHPYMPKGVIQVSA